MMIRFKLIFFYIGWVPCWFRLQAKATHTHTHARTHAPTHTHAKPCCKRRLAENGHTTGVVFGGSTTGFCCVGFHVGFQLNGRGHHGKGTMGVRWFPASRVWERTMGKVPSRSMLGSILVSSFQGMGEATIGKVPWGSMLVSMGKVPWGSMLGFMLGSMLVSSFQGVGEVSWFPACRVWERSLWGFHAGFHVGFQHSGYGRGHHGKGTVGVHVGFHAGFQCWFPAFRVWERSLWERYHGRPCWVPCKVRVI